MFFLRYRNNFEEKSTDETRCVSQAKQSSNEYRSNLLKSPATQNIILREVKFIGEHLK